MAHVSCLSFLCLSADAPTAKGASFVLQARALRNLMLILHSVTVRADDKKERCGVQEKTRVDLALGCEVAKEK
jgi:hypothetical protein